MVCSWRLTGRVGDVAIDGRVGDVAVDGRVGDGVDSS